MKLKTVFLLMVSIFCLSALAQAQGFLATFYWYDDGVGDPEPPIADACVGGNPLADGSATIQIFWDNDSNGPDADDPLAPLCIDPPNCFEGPAGTLNFNQFAINGDEQGVGTGYFISPLAFASTGIVPDPARYYLRICSGNAFWESSIITLTAGPHDVGPGLEIPFTFTCFDSVCAGCLPPPSPGGFTASTNRCDGVMLNWTYPSGVQDLDEFRILRNGTQVATVTDTAARNYLDTGASGTNIAYQIIAHKSCDAESAPAAATGSRVTSPPTPTGVTATDNSCNQVVINWTYSSNGGLQRWVITRNGTPVDSINHNGQVPGPRSYTHTNAPGGTAQYCVRGSSDACGWGTAGCDSGRAVVAPAQVQGVNATDGNCATTLVTWQDVIDESGYQIYRSNQDGSGRTQIGTRPADSLSYSDATGAAGTIYRYDVVATNACGAGQPSQYDLGSRLAAPSAPGGVAASENDCNMVTVTWNNVAGEDSFQVRRDGNRIGMTLTDVLTFSDTTAVAGTSYSYTVAAYNSCGNNVSSADQGMRLPIPGQVQNVQATDSRCDSIVVTWTALVGTQTYHIFRDASEVGTSTGTRFAHAPAVGTGAYTVRGDNVCGQGTISAPNNGTRVQGPQPPAWVSASDDTCNSVWVNWGAATGQVDRYLIFRNGTQIRSVPADTTDYIILDSPVAGRYQYCVRAHSDSVGCGDSPQVCDSGSVHVIPGAPANLQAGPAICDQVNLTWNAATGEVTGYIIFRDATNIDSTSTTSYADTGVDDMASHNYVVQAYNMCGQGNASNQVAGRVRELLLAPAIGDSLASGDSLDVPLDHCTGVDSDSVFVSLNNGPYEFVAAFAPVQSTVTLPIPVVQQTTDNNRFKFVSTRGERRDSVITDPFVILVLAVHDYSSVIPDEFFLDQNYPNPFNPSTTIRFGVPHSAIVTVEIYDVTGRKSATLVNEVLQPGIHSVEWNCSACPTGMYIVRLQTEEHTFMRKMLMMK